MSDSAVCKKCETDHHGLPEGSMAALAACVTAQAQALAVGAGDLTVRLAAAGASADEVEQEKPQ